jgi:hypothetical protein
VPGRQPQIFGDTESPSAHREGLAIAPPVPLRRAERAGLRLAPARLGLAGAGYASLATPRAAYVSRKTGWSPGSGNRVKYELTAPLMTFR